MIVLPDALARALPLLEPEARPPHPSAPRGYLDVLRTDGDPATAGRVPWWKGLLAPGARDERRITRLLLGLRPGDGVLDVGCGTGELTRELAAVAGEAGLVVGLDASSRMLDRAAREGAVAVAWVRGDAVRLPFREGSFDAVSCVAALHLLADPWEALDHMSRVLTPGGRLAIFTTCRVRTAPLRAVQGLAGLRLFGAEEMVGALRERGFVNVHQRVHGLTQFVGGRLSS